ncbi:peptidase S41 [Pyxidicoccus fallax]|uniref:Peptidase S41 n=1 Tax=Pyxidicoccus fallax TaxID=394095 RepID=A0A848LZ86_9BACT|nr:S41 family peptidase [Pyxidicoccus fallax]NMO23166.1 peptidase S41 [Pyxidicoccus fallax]NPC84337.1 peptidase S41 [Pyxidicoccus fallax]
MSHHGYVVPRRIGRRRLSRLTFSTVCLGLLLGSEALAQSAPPEDWCDRAAAGPAGTRPGSLGLSAAHAQLRFFGTNATNLETDMALAAVLEGATVDWDAAATAYAAALEPACALDATRATLRPVQVLNVGPIAFIRPGTGAIHLPRQTRAVVIDLRGLPAAPGLEQALANAIGAASSAPVERVSRRVRVHEGVTDEINFNRYWNDVEVQASTPYAATGRAELPVALLTGRTLAPAAARFAVDLRMARRAWLVGEPVSTAVAETRWMPIADKGLLIRTEQLEDAQGVVPDLIPADLDLSLPLGDGAPERSAVQRGLGNLEFLGQPGPVDRTAPVQRPPMRVREPLNEPFPPIAASSSIARANLLIVHGTTRLFYPYFHVVGDGIDARLQETLASVDASPVTDRKGLQQRLLRFNEVLADGHGFVFPIGGVLVGGFFPVTLEQVAGEPVIRRSLVPGVEPGDTLVSVAGRPMSEWLAEEMSRASAATPGYLHDVAARRLLELSGPTEFGLRSVDGITRTVTVLPQPHAQLLQVGDAPTHRPAGRLTDLGAPTLHYINMSDEVLPSIAAFNEALAGAAGASGLVIDMRGYPAGNHYEAARRLIPETFYSPIFRVPYWAGPDQMETHENWYEWTPLSNPSYGGPIVLLVGPNSVSAAENFSIMLTAAGRVTVIGRRSAGTNGNITRLSLPGRMMVYFTGMEVLFPDRTRFHGVGIVPDIESAPTAVDIAAGRDTELLRAIQFLTSGN